MSKDKDNHNQCKLKRGKWFTYSWIPSKFAKIGKIVKLRGEDGWEVIEVYGKSNSKEVNKRSQDHKHQRKASDV